MRMQLTSERPFQSNSSLVPDQWSPVFLIQDFLGHKTHAQLLERALKELNFDQARVTRFSSSDYSTLPRTLIRIAGARIPINCIQRTGLDFFATRSMMVQGFLANLAAHSFNGKPDLVYVHSHSASNVVHKFGEDVPVVISMDSALIADARMRGLPVSTLDQPAIKMEQRAFERADLIVAFSDWVRDSLVNDYGVPIEKTTTIRNGVIRPTMAPGDCAELSHIDLPVVGHVGNDFLRKGGDLLLEAHQKYLVEKAHLVIVTRDNVELGPLKNVTVLKDVDREYLLSHVLPRFTVYAHPARVDWSPFSLIEALATGLPAVATGVGSIPEMVKDGTNGYIVTPGEIAELAERLSQIVENPSLAEDFGKASCNRFLQYYDASVNYPELVQSLSQLSLDSTSRGR